MVVKGLPCQMELSTVPIWVKKRLQSCESLEFLHSAHATDHTIAKNFAKNSENINLIRKNRPRHAWNEMSGSSRSICCQIFSSVQRLEVDKTSKKRNGQIFWKLKLKSNCTDLLQNMPSTELPNPSCGPSGLSPSTYLQALNCQSQFIRNGSGSLDPWTHDP